jgi:hypothetical protein
MTRQQRRWRAVVRGARRDGDGRAARGAAGDSGTAAGGDGDGSGREARMAGEGKGLGNTVEHVAADEQCPFSIKPILEYFPYKFDFTIPNFTYMHFT